MSAVRAGHVRLVLLLDAAALGAVAGALVVAVGLPLAARGALTPAVIVVLAGSVALAVAAAGALLLLRSVGAPVDRLVAAAESLGRGAAGDLPVLAPPGEPAGRGLSRAAVAFERTAAALAAERARLAEKVAELEGANAELVRARESLLRAERLATLGRIASGIAHEVGNPLGAIAAYVELAKDRLAAAAVRTGEGSSSGADVMRPARAAAPGGAPSPGAPAPADRVCAAREARAPPGERGSDGARSEPASSRRDGAGGSPPGRAGGAATPLDEVDDFLARVAAEVERIDGLVRDLLDLARPPEPAPGAVEVSRPLDAALRLASVQRRFGAVKVELALPPDLPPVVGDERRLAQVFLNLLLNAADAMEGEGALRVEARREPDAVALRFEDRGPGIPADDLPRVFEPFFTTKAAGQGTGLGLAVSQGIVRSFGGEIAAENAPGGGAVFTVKLRVAVDP